MHQSGKIICLFFFTLFVFGNGQLPPDFHNSSHEGDFSGDIGRFFLEPLPNPDEISGNVVGPKKMPGVNFTSIQDALDQCKSGAIIYVLSGDYNENLNLNKSGVILRGVDTGEGAPVVSAVGHSSTINITASACTVDGFVVMNSGNPEAGILVFSEGNRISNNTLKNNKGYGIHSKGKSGNIIYGNKINNNGFDGIYLEDSSNNSILYNSITENNINGIYLKNSDNNILKGNTFLKNSKYDILLENSNSNIIIDNSYDRLKEIDSKDNIKKGNTNPKEKEPSETLSTEPDQPDEILFLQVLPGGSIQQALDSISPGGSIQLLGGKYSGPIVLDKANIAIMGEGSPEIQGNGVDSTITLSGSGATLSGLVVTNSGNPHAGIDVRAPNCLIHGCQISNNHGYGISIISSSGIRITDDTIADNGLGGIIMENCRNNQIDLNRITSNGAIKGGHGVTLQGSSENIIYQNALDNAINAWSNSENIWHTPTEIEYKGNTTYVGNSWSDYAGWDCNGDSIGDSPYPIPGGSEQDSFPLTNRTGTTLTVCASGCNFTSIQAAINAACPGDTIEVESGTYYENVDVNKALILTGIGSPVVDGSSTGNAITVNADGCTIQGFVARNSGDGAGIRINSKNNTISSNTAIGNDNGIYLDSSSGNIISGNTASDNVEKGIYLKSSTGNQILSNTAAKNRNNVILDSSSSNSISSNTIEGNEAEMNLSIGIILQTSSDNTMDGNTIMYNRHGIYLQSSNRNIIYQNALDNAINAWSNSENIWHTPTEIEYKGNTTYVGNSWSDYAGWDCNGDGIGDSPYPIPGGSERDSFPLTNRTGTRTLTVCASGCDFTSIQAAINAACPGDTIEVESGTYYENVDVNKALILTGIGSPVVDGSSTGNAITVNADGCTIQGFVARNSGDGAGIRINSKNNTISSNTAIGNDNGIYVISPAAGNTISGNTANNNSGNGIYLVSSSNNNIVDNDVTRSYRGIYLYSSSNSNTISGNTATGNEVDGIYLVSSSGNTISDNLATSNNFGICFVASSSNIISDNLATGNYDCGIYLYYNSNGNTLSDNLATGSYHGIFLDFSSSNIISGNTANNNSVNGIYPYNSSNNNIVDNEVIGNANGISLFSSSSNIISGNTATGNSDHGINLDSSSNNIISDNTATDNTAYGIYIQDSPECTLSSNRADNNKGHGIRIYLSDGNAISSNSATGNSQNGIYVQDSSGCTLSSNTADNNKGHGIALDSAENNNVSNNYAIGNAVQGIWLCTAIGNAISGNTVNRNTKNGVYIRSSSDNTISGNTATGNSDHGINLDSSSNNNISDNTVTENTAYGIYIQDSSECTLSSNTADNNKGHGIRIYLSDSNAISGNSATGNSQNGIYVQDSSGCTLSSNTADNNKGHGIALDSAENNNVSNNYAIGNAVQGIWLCTAIGNAISGNTVNRNTKNGIYIRSSSDNTISGNTATDNDVAGINLDSSSENTISSNTAVENDENGIYLQSSTGNQILSNTAAKNRNNIILDSSSSNSISSNWIEGNEAEMNLSIGIILQTSSDNTMDGNDIMYNRYGIHLQSSSNSNIISNNRATNNRESGICLESSNSNTIFGNHFDLARSNGVNLWNTADKVIYNYEGVLTNYREYYNYTGNYWSDYSGPDGDHDGIGNVPYSIEGGSEKDYYPLLDGVTLNISDSIRISQEGSLKTGQPSSNARYVLIVTNLGDSELTNISITDQLSKGIAGTFVESGPDPDISQEEENGTRTLLWQDPGPLRPGETKEINLVALIEDELPETLISKASVQATSEDGQKLNDEDTLELNAAANISIEKTADRSFAQPSDSVTFSINITNTGQKELVSVLVNDNLPQGISYVSGDSNATASGDLVSWQDLGPMQPGESKFIRLIGVVKEDASGVQTNTVSVTANTTCGGFVFASDRADLDILSLNVSKQADRKTVKRGENITYTITICNAGSLPLDNVIAWDAIDSQVILLYSSMETEEDGKWHLGTLAPGQCAVIILMVQVPKTNLKFDMTSSVSGEGYVNVADDYSTTLPEFVIKNTVDALSSSTNKQIQDTSLVTVLGEVGTELSSREHGSGLYQSEEMLRMITENKSIQMNKSVTARQQPVVLRLYDMRTVNSSSPWTERTQAKNRITGTSMTSSFSHARNISLESHLKLDENESVMEQSSEFDGLGRFGLQKKQVNGKTSLLDIQEEYAGSFKVYQKIDEYGSSVISKKSASGSGFVAGDRRIGESQRSHESGTGNYSSQEEIQTYTNYINKDINLTTYPVGLNPTISTWPNRSLNWSEGIRSRDPGSTYLGEEYRNLVDMEKQTLVMGLNIIQTEANFTGSSSYRQVIEGEMDLEQEYIGKYSIRQKTSIQGTARYDRPHINVIKDGEIISQSNPSKTYARYKIAVENDGNKMLSPVYVKDLFPPKALYVNSSIRPSLTSSSANWTLTNLPVGGRSEITLWLEMGEELSSTLVNRVEASGSHDAGWAYSSNISVIKSGWLELPPSEDQIVVKKSAYVNESASDLVWYHLSIENLCNCTTSLIVTDSLPQGMKLVEATPDITSFDRESNAITWNVISLKPQGTMSIIYKVQVTKGGRLVNQVRVEAVSPEGCDMKPAYDSTALTIGNKSGETSLDDWMPPEEWDLQCSGTSCP